MARNELPTAAVEQPNRITVADARMMNQGPGGDVGGPKSSSTKPGTTGGSSTGGSSGKDKMAPSTGNVEVPERGSGQWMNSKATLASTGLVSGTTRTWCTNTWSGFHGSVLPVLVDAKGKAVWPTNPQAEKHQYGVDGTLFSGDDRTDAWTNHIPANLLALGVELKLVQYLDPKNMLVRDLVLIGKTVGDVMKALGV